MIGFGWLMELIAVPFLAKKQRVCQELFIFPTEKNSSLEMNFATRWANLTKRGSKKQHSDYKMGVGMDPAIRTPVKGAG